MRRCAAITFVVLLATAVAAQETVEQLKERAAAAKVQEQPKLFLEVAAQQLKTADAAYNEGNVDAGRAAVDDVASYSEKAATAAISSRKHLKHTEIKIRDMAHKLDGIRRTLNFEDREPLQEAISRMEKLRSDLLNAMFAPKS